MPTPASGHPADNPRRNARDLRALERLRDRRAYRDRAPDTPARFADLAHHLARDAKRNAGIGDAWARHCPDHLRPHTRVIGFAKGTLRVAVPNDAVKHDLDRFLRTGGFTQLAKSAPATLRRVQFSRQPMAPPPDAG